MLFGLIVPFLSCRYEKLVQRLGRNRDRAARTARQIFEEIEALRAMQVNPGRTSRCL